MLLITRPESSARSTFVEPDWIRLIAFVLAIVNHSFLILVYVFLQAIGWLLRYGLGIFFRLLCLLVLLMF